MVVRTGWGGETKECEGTGLSEVMKMFWILTVLLVT